MKRKVTLEKFKNDCLKVIKYYRSDLDIDMKIVGKKVSAVFFAYECGSHAIELPEFERYPAAGERVRYLFGSADRRHILNETGSTLECESVKSAKVIHYFDGTNMYRVDRETAVRLINGYKQKMAEMFRKYNSAAHMRVVKEAQCKSSLYT